MKLRCRERAAAPGQRHLRGADPVGCSWRSAQEIGDLLMFAFRTPTGIPHGTINLKSLRSYNPSWSGGASGAELHAVQLSTCAGGVQ